MEEQSADEGGVATATRQGPAEPAGLERGGGREERWGWRWMRRKVVGIEMVERFPGRAPTHTQDKTKRSHSFLSLSLYTLTFIDPSGQRCEALPDILLKHRLVTLMPSTQRRSPFNNVPCCPQDPHVVHLSSRLVIRHQNVKVPSPHTLEHELHRLQRRPCPCRLVLYLIAIRVGSGQSRPGVPRTNKTSSSTPWRQPSQGGRT